MITLLLSKATPLGELTGVSPISSTDITLDLQHIHPDLVLLSVWRPCTVLARLCQSEL